MKLFRNLFLILFTTGYMTFDIKNPLSEESFECILDRIENIKETPEFLEWHLKVRKVNKTRALVGYILINQPLGKDFIYEGTVLKKQGGEYKYLPYKIPRAPHCEFINTDKLFYPDFASNSDYPQPGNVPCPFPAGNYSFRGSVFHMKEVPKALIQTGEFAMEFLMYKNDELIAQYRVYGYINKY